MMVEHTPVSSREWLAELAEQAYIAYHMGYQDAAESGGFERYATVRFADLSQAEKSGWEGAAEAMHGAFLARHRVDV